jgi:hypothetical protein
MVMVEHAKCHREPVEMSGKDRVLQGFEQACVQLFAAAIKENYRSTSLLGDENRCRWAPMGWFRAVTRVVQVLPCASKEKW